MEGKVHRAIVRRVSGALEAADDFGNQSADDLKRMYKTSHLASSLLLSRIVLPGAVAIVVVSLAVYFIFPSHTNPSRSRCQPFDHSSLVAQVAEDPGSMFISPLVYAVGTGAIGATVAQETYDKEGVHAMFRALRSGEGPARSAAIAGACVAFLLMCAGGTDWKSMVQNKERVEDIHCSAKSEPAPTLASLVTNNLSTFVAFSLSCLGNALLVDESFAHGRLRSGTHVTKLLLDVLVLSTALCIRARQKGASMTLLAKYGGLLSSIYTSSLMGGLALSYIRVDKSCLGHFNSAFVPLVMTWTLLADLAPDASLFTDDAGQTIPSDMRLSSETAYLDDAHNVREVGPVAYVFNQRGVIKSTVMVLSFYATIRYFNPLSDVSVRHGSE
tara:strand:- start:919 stop:2076 length:1158 start_codon:yes stop_codon:yes gene_type:complete